MSPTIQVSASLADAPADAADAADAAGAAGAAARFVVGQDPEGHWVAIEIHGRAGGLFRDRQAAVQYAEAETGHRPDAVRLSGERLALRL